MATNPNVAAAIAEAKSAADWITAQFLSLWSGHKTAVIVIGACGFVAGCVFR